MTWEPCGSDGHTGPGRQTDAYTSQIAVKEIINTRLYVMTFEEFWADVGSLNMLPMMAINQLPMSLSDNTKKRLMQLNPVEAVKLIDSAIDEINHGSVETIDCLLKKKLK